MCVVLALSNSVPCSSSLHSAQPSFSTAASQMSTNRPICSSPPAVPLIEHLRRLKHGTPTSPLLAATLSTSSTPEPFQTSHDIGLKDLLLGNDEVIASDKTSAADAAASPDKLAQYTRHSPATLTSPVVASPYRLPDPRIFDMSGRHLRPAIILKQLLEDRSEPIATSPSVSELFEVGSKSSEGVSLDAPKTGGANRSLSASELMLEYNNPVYESRRPSSSLTPTDHAQPPFVQLITSVEDTLGVKQSLPSAQPLTFSVAELTSVSHLWSPPPFTSHSNCIDQLSMPSSLHQSQTSDVASLMTVASSPSLGTLTSSGGLQLKVTTPRMAPSRNVLLRVSVPLRIYIAHSCMHSILCFYCCQVQNKNVGKVTYIGVIIVQ